MAKLISVFIVTVLIANGQSAPKLPRAGGPISWLDKDGDVKAWNKPGSAIPRAPRRAELDEQCTKDRYHAVTAEEKSVAQAHWFLSARGLEHNGITVIGAQAANDGMCRPMQYQQFVFVHGKYAGTISPVLMDSREDASIGNVVVPGDGRIVADFTRYLEKDARCCPSRISEVTYEIEDRTGGPVVVVKTIKTRRVE